METSEQEHVAVDVTASFKPAAKGRTQGTERPSESDVPQRPPSCRKVLLDWTQHPPRSPRSRSRPYSSLHPPALRSAEFAATDLTWSAASPTAPAHFTTLSGPRQCQRLCPRRSNSDPHPAAECRLAQLRQAQVRSRVVIELVEIRSHLHRHLGAPRDLEIVARLRDDRSLSCCSTKSCSSGESVQPSRDRPAPSLGEAMTLR